MYKKMLVPLDGSELAEAVLPYARKVAWRLGIEVVLLQVCAPAHRDMAPMCRAYVEKAAQTMSSRPEEAGPGAVAQKTATVLGETVIGDPAEEILSFAEQHSVDLILMGRRGSSGLKRWTIGNVADKVLRAAKVPVWLMPAGIAEAARREDRPTLSMLVPLDGSGLAEVVLSHVEALSRQWGAASTEVALLSVCEPVTLPSDEPPSFPPNWNDYLDKCRQLDRRYLAGIETRLTAIGIKVRAEVLVGKAAEQIVDYAGKGDYDLIAMATHGRSGASRWIYGSVAEKVLQAATIPILMVKS